MISPKIIRLTACKTVIKDGEAAYYLKDDEDNIIYLFFEKSNYLYKDKSAVDHLKYWVYWRDKQPDKRLATDVTGPPPPTLRIRPGLTDLVLVTGTFKLPSCIDCRASAVKIVDGKRCGECWTEDRRQRHEREISGS